MIDLEREHYLETSVAKEISSFIRLISFSPEWAAYRANYGTNGVIKLFLKFIEDTFE